MDRLVQLLMAPFVVGVAIIWVFVGLVFATPLIAKAILIFTIDLLVSAMTQQRHSRAAEGLKNALTFYPKGFAIIFSSLSLALEPPSEAERAYEFAQGRWGPLIDSGKMILLALTFWGATALFFHHLGVVRIVRIAALEQSLVNLVGLGPPRAAAALAPFAPDCTTTAANANLREAARRGAPSMARLPQGEALALRDDPFAGDNWIAVATHDGRAGFIARSLIVCGTPPR
jgi:hypothetical protein